MTLAPGGKGIICRHHRTFWGSGTPALSALGGRLERPSTSPRFTPPRPTPAARPDLAPRPCNPRARIPAPSPGRNAAEEAFLGPRQSDRQTNRQTTPDGRARRALRGPGGECPHPVVFLLLLAREISWTDPWGCDTEEGRAPGEGNRPARLTPGLGDLLNQAVPQETNPVKGASRRPSYRTPHVSGSCLSKRL